MSVQLLLKTLKDCRRETPASTKLQTTAQTAQERFNAYENKIQKEYDDAEEVASRRAEIKRSSTTYKSLKEQKLKTAKALSAASEKEGQQFRKDRRKVELALITNGQTPETVKLFKAFAEKYKII